MSEDQSGQTPGGGGSKEGIGPRRLVVGAHYGLQEWMLQRITAVIVAIYGLLLIALLMSAPRLSYEGWSSIFFPVWMKLVTLIALFAVFYHAWIGIRDIWMDYVKPAGIRLGLQVLTVLFLLYCTVWSVQILWRV